MIHNNQNYKETKFVVADLNEQDLSHITDKLWNTFYMQQFGAKNTTVVTDIMKQKPSFSWRQLYEAKQKDV